MSEMTDAYVKLDKVSKIYGTKEVKIVAVDEISFEIAKGEFVVIVGIGEMILDLYSSSIIWCLILQRWRT